MNLQKFSPWNWFKKEDTAGLPMERRPDWDYPMGRLHRDIDRVFDEMLRSMNMPSSLWNKEWGESPFPSKAFIKPEVDIRETDNAYAVTVEVPGVDEKDIQVTLEDDTLTIRGEKKQETVTDKEKYHRVERHYGSFQRVLCLPENADRDHVKASFKDGVLQLDIAKLTEGEHATKRISINTH